jgi:hypothetical protein
VLDRLCSFGAKAFASRNGSVAVLIAILLTVMIGFVALGTEVAYLLVKYRQMQTAADSAALGGAIALGTGYPTDLTLEARAAASQAGFTQGVNGTGVAVNNPPLSGSHLGDSSAVEVIINQSQAVSLLQLFDLTSVDVHARAVALAGSLGGLYCVLALDPTASGAVALSNNAVVTNPNCGVAVNSSSNSALTVSNNAAINGPVSVHGGWSLSNNATLNGKPTAQNAPVIPDPYSGVQLQTAPSCTAQSGTVSGNQTKSLQAGHFCSGFNFTNNAIVTLGAGAYYIDQQLKISNNVRLNATAGVTLIVNGNYAMSIGNNVTINLTAQSTGVYAGLAFFGLRTATKTVQQSFSNNTVLNVTGAIYFPNQIVNFGNNSQTGGARCTQLIGRIINISNNVYLDHSCTGTGVKPVNGTSSQLVE